MTVAVEHPSTLPGGLEVHDRRELAAGVVEFEFAPAGYLTKKGEPPTDLKARTGEFTPPGISLRALAKRSLEMSISSRISAQWVCAVRPRRPAV